MAYLVKKSEKELLIERSVTIQQYFDDIIIPSGYYDAGTYGVDFELRATVCCPLHDEDTPSFRYYPETTSFYCFGCGAGGNIVNLHMKFMTKVNGTYVKKEEAIDFLYNYFIAGKKAVPIVQQVNLDVKKKNSEVEIARFAKYANELENSLLDDKKVDIEKKIALWDKLDEISLLVRIDKVSATEAKEELRQEVNKLYN